MRRIDIQGYVVGLNPGLQAINECSETELRWILWCVDYISIKLLIKKSKAEFGRGINLRTEKLEQTPKRINANKSMARRIEV